MRRPGEYRSAVVRVREGRVKRNLFIAVVVLLLGGGGFLLYYFSDQQVIIRRCHGVAAALAKKGAESSVVLALKMKEVKDFLAPACEVVVPEREYREVLDSGLAIRYLIMYRSRRADLQVTFAEILVEIPSKGRAEVSALVGDR
jgi:hypothetical protein